MEGGVVFGVTSHCILAPHLSHLLSANFAEIFYFAAIGFEQTALHFKRCREHSFLME
jgi:hypothetical protein